MCHFYKIIGVLSLLFIAHAHCHGQDDGALFFIGHPFFNDKVLFNTKVTVRSGAKVITEFTTKNNNNDFKVELPYGKVYDIHFYHEKCQAMFIRVLADRVPDQKRVYNMTYDLKIPFFPKDDRLIDTNQFKQPFHQIIFNGKKDFVDDTAYMNQFIKNIYKKQAPEPVTNTKELVQLVGKLCIDNDKQTPLRNKTVNLIDTKGQIISSTRTSHQGKFVFPQVNQEQAKGLTMLVLPQENPTGQRLKLMTNHAQLITSSPYTENNATTFTNSDSLNVIYQLIDNQFKYDIAGKLITTNGVERKVASHQTVYLMEKNKKVIKKAQTDALGNFVFPKISPWQTYYLAYDTLACEPNFKMELYSTKDKFIYRMDSTQNNKFIYRFLSVSHSAFNDLIIDESELQMTVKGKLYGDNQNNPLNDFKVVLLNDQFTIIDSCITNQYGDFLFTRLPYNKSFSISAENDKNRLDVFNNILVYDNAGNLVKLLPLVRGAKFNYKPLAVEQSLLTELYVDDAWLGIINKDKKAKTEHIIEPILFEFNKADLQPQSEQTLDKVVLAMQSNSHFVVELSAHTDSKGSDQYNLRLSEQRAMAAKHYIVRKLIDPNRILVKGYGETKLLNNCGNTSVCSEDEHAVNRRLEFKLFFN